MSCKAMAFAPAAGRAHTRANIRTMETHMLLAIESFVRLFERLLIETPIRRAAPLRHADNDNDEMSEDDRRWAAYR
jgi:hypothetical protein